MTEQSKTRIPAPLYAAAGVGDLAYQQLRKLPAVVTELRGRATGGTADLRHRATATGIELRERAVATLKAANGTAADLRGKAATNELDMDRLREAARRNANVMLAEARAAQLRAVEAYHRLVAHGERVVGTGVVQAADTVNADIEATEAPAELTGTPAEVAAKAAAAEPAIKRANTAKATKAPAKRNRPAAGK
jgi:heparin binding hemagglutinin HbhA